MHRVGQEVHQSDNCPFASHSKPESTGNQNEFQKVVHFRHFCRSGTDCPNGSREAEEAGKKDCKFSKSVYVHLMKAYLIILIQFNHRKRRANMYSTPLSKRYQLFWGYSKSRIIRRTESSCSVKKCHSPCEITYLIITFYLNVASYSKINMGFWNPVLLVCIAILFESTISLPVITFSTPRNNKTHRHPFRRFMRALWASSSCGNYIMQYTFDNCVISRPECLSHITFTNTF